MQFDLKNVKIATQGDGSLLLTDFFELAVTLRGESAARFKKHYEEQVKAGRLSASFHVNVSIEEPTGEFIG